MIPSALGKVLQAHRRLAIAVSGGVDSSVLLAASVRVLGAESCLALNAGTPYMMQSEQAQAVTLAEKLGVELVSLGLPLPPAIANNPPDRCYQCKRMLFDHLLKLARTRGFDLVADGSNADDLLDYRPGRRALQELGIISPFVEAEMGKEEIRGLARDLGLPADLADKPAYACLLTRLEHGMTVDPELLRAVDAAESYIRAGGIMACRVRVHGAQGKLLARIECPASSIQAVADMPGLESHLRALGFHYITLDLTGYRMGGMNDIGE